ncbi:uncharacterized protein [Antedon mediterranea]|uniref:uncharacterized protein n=1 Tax=Antedon mediterranea TaxID=105859 RepID=UPI003AF89A9E
MAAVQDIPTYSGSGVSVNKVSWKEVSPVRPSRKKSQRSNGRSSPSRKRVNSGGHRSNLRPSSRKAVLQPRPPVKEQDIQSNEDTFQNEDRTVIRSRARRRRPWEASPFLSVNTVSPDKIVVDLDPQESPASSHHTSARPMRMEQTMSRNQSSQLRRSRTPKLASRCSSRTTPFDFYSFYTHKYEDVNCFSTHQLISEGENGY